MRGDFFRGKLMRKIFLILSVLLLVIFTENFSEASPKDDLQASYEKMRTVKNGRLTLNLTGHIFNKEAKLIINSDFSLKPKFAAVGNMKIAKKTYSFFIEDSYDSYTLHYKERKDKNWNKNTFKKEDFDRQQNPDMKTIDKLRYPKGYMAEGESVDFKDGKYYVTISPDKVVAALTEIVERHGKDTESIERTKKLFSGLSPVIAEIRLNKEGFVKEGKFELTPLIKEVKEKIAADEKIAKKTKRLVAAAYSDATIKFTLSDLDNVEVVRPSNEK